MARGTQGGPVAARFATRPVVVALTGALALALGLVALGDSGGGRLLFGAAALVAAAECLRGLVLRPTLEVTDAGVLVVQGWRRELLTWDALDHVGTQRRVRRGATARWLELDTADQRVTVPAYRLGASVTEVAAAIEAGRRLDS